MRWSDGWGSVGGGASAFLTDERLRDHRAPRQTVRDRSLPGKGQVY